VSESLFAGAVDLDVKMRERRAMSLRIWTVMADLHIRDCVGRRACPRVKEFAATLRLSRDQASRAFAESTGFPVATYFRRCQLAMARWLLAHSRIAVTQIGAKVGFQSSRSFLRAFKRVNGMTPSEYRAAHKMSSRPRRLPRDLLDEIGGNP
jgi:AraC-like DNA-binding protein